MSGNNPERALGELAGADEPTRIGTYELLSRIGAGAMGEVYLAHDGKLQRRVSIKFLWPHVARDPLRLQRFEAEARAVSSLNHPNILVVHDFGVATGRPYLVTEFVEGETLRTLLAGGALGVRDAIGIGLQITSAIAAAHARGIIHRDLKPENVMVRPDGYVKVLDFGLAKLTAGADTGSTCVDVLRTEPGVVMGTVPYMSPEQARGMNLDVRSDVWSLGVMLYEMLAGQRPFAGATAGDLIAAILRHEPSPVSVLAAVPAPLDRIVTKSLRKLPSDRYESARELHEDLERMKLALDSVPRSVSSPSCIKETVARPVATRKRRARALRSLAVLPLRNLSRDPQEEYFSEGMTEALIATLGQLGSLRVISRTTAMHYKDSNKPLPEIGRELNVDAILEGAVLTAGERVRITAQLIDAGSDAQLWAGRYERELRDVLDLQNDVSRAIVDEIRLRVTPRERARLRQTRQVDPDAYRLYLRGRFHWHKRNQQNVYRAIEYFQQALARDPNYAEAHAGLADSYLLLGIHLCALPPREWTAAARLAAERALQIDEGLAAAHNSLAFTSLQQWDWLRAGRELRRSVELNPRDPVTHNWLGNYLAALGRVEEAIQAGERAIALDPLTLSWNMGLGHFYYLARQYDAAIDQELRTLEMDSSFYLTFWILGLAYEQKGRLADSVAALEKASKLSGGVPMKGLLARAYAVAGQRADASALLKELTGLAQPSVVPPDILALVHAGLGDTDRAIDLLLQGCETPSFFSLLFLKVSPLFDSLRTHPLFPELLRRANLEPAA